MYHQRYLKTSTIIISHRQSSIFIDFSSDNPLTSELFFVRIKVTFSIELQWQTNVSMSMKLGSDFALLFCINPQGFALKFWEIP